MEYFYVIASLPMLNFGDKPPLTQEEFEACCSPLTEEDALELRCILDERIDEGLSPFMEKWRNAERQIRDAVVIARAGKRNVDAAAYLKEYSGFDLSIEREVEEAWTKGNPLDRESALDRCRWRLADEISLGDPFGLASVLAYAVKLKILLRWAALEEEKGQQRIEELIVGGLTEEGSMSEIMSEEVTV
ncbi:MAG: DUF2764 family protein [Spartobacteria bacterium]|nr:DUF2764 family protein [Spartobacteria bacterium]